MKWLADALRSIADRLNPLVVSQHVNEIPRPPVDNGSEITIVALRIILRQAIGPAGEIYLADKAFRLCSLEDIERVLDWDETNHHKYVAEKYDCDDYTKRLVGQFAVPGWANLALGIIWTATHAMVVMVDVNRDVWYIEPQDDSRRSDLLDWHGAMRFVVI